RHHPPDPPGRRRRTARRPLRHPLRPGRGQSQRPPRPGSGRSAAAGTTGVQHPVPPGSRRGPPRRGRTLRRIRRTDVSPARPGCRTVRVKQSMPCRSALSSVLVIGSGPIVIGQAAEFDYSGTQACRVLKAEGLRVVLVNSNPATIMTDPEIADATYVEPITPEMIEKILAKE